MAVVLFGPFLLWVRMIPCEQFFVCRDASDRLPNGLPTAPAAELFLSYLRPELAVAQLPQLRGLNWVPVPQLAPQPCSCSLSATRDADGELPAKLVIHVTSNHHEVSGRVSYSSTC